MPKLRLQLDDDAPRKLDIAINRSDIPPGEPGALQRFVDLSPGESIAVEVHERCIITIIERSPDATPAG